ncbi:MAG: hypothetical protein FWF70_08120 [Bacteroidetes bacterium]|nr:hypothetical protein [Bacteroidota bacterium]MCL1968217.1 hypothetical protein [Bacteroidota bacterium]
MKKTFLLLSFLCFSASVFAQDVIITKENERIVAKVLKVYDAVVKYALFSDPDGETFLISKTKINTILYEDGVVETYDNTSANNVESKTVSDKTPMPINSSEKIFHNVIKLKPFATIVGLIIGLVEFDIQYTRYLTNKVGIPVEVDLFGAPGYGMSFALMTGIEAVPATHRQKSGLLLNALVGAIVYDKAGVLVNANIGYQLVTKKGFVFATTIGPMYSGLTNKVTVRFSLDFGVAF